MFGKRDFLEDSSSSFEADHVGTPPPYNEANNVFSQHHENEFEFEDKSNQNQDFFTSPTEKPRGIPITSAFQPVKKEYHEKIAFVNIIEEVPQEIHDRPTTSVRPGSSSAQMRAKMLEAQKNKLMSRPGGNTIVQNNLLISGKTDSAPLDNFIFANTVYTEKDISGTRALKAFKPGESNYEPSAIRNQHDIIPGPIKSEVTTIKNDDIEEVKLEESSAIHIGPSKNLQEIQKRIEESRKLTSANYILPQSVNMNPQPQRITEIKQEKPTTDERFKAEEVSKYEIKQEKLKIDERSKTEEMQKYDGKPKLALEQTPLKIQVPLPAKEQLKEIERTLGEEEKRIENNPDRTKKNDSMQESPVLIHKAPSVNIRAILENEMRDMKKFLTTPIIRGIILQCTIRRDKSGFNRLFPKYYMSLSEGLTFLLAGKKRAGNRTSNYMVTMHQKDFNTKSSSFLGKVRSNFLGTEFMLYDNGLNPKRKGANPNNIRSELGVVLYVSTI